MISSWPSPSAVSAMSERCPWGRRSLQLSFRIRCVISAELGGNRLPSTGDPRGDRSERHFHFLCNLHVTFPFDVELHKRVSHDGREPLDGFSHVCVALFRREHFSGARSGV